MRLKVKSGEKITVDRFYGLIHQISWSMNPGEFDPMIGIAPPTSPAKRKSAKVENVKGL